MGLIIESSVLIASERRGEMLEEVVLRIQARLGQDSEVGLSAVSFVELTNRAQTAFHRAHRTELVAEFYRDLVVHPPTIDIARLAGRIEGEQAARGIIIACEDLVTGATALHLGFDVATLNVRYFQHVPDLNVVTL